MAAGILILVAGIAGVVIGGGTRKAEAQAAPASPGRYQLIFNPELARNTFVLDSATGRVWGLVTYTDLRTDPRVWILMDREDTDADRVRIGQKYGSKPEPSGGPSPPR